MDVFTCGIFSFKSVLIEETLAFIKTVSRSLWYVQSAIHFTIMMLLLIQLEPEENRGNAHLLSSLTTDRELIANLAMKFF